MTLHTTTLTVGTRRVTVVPAFGFPHYAADSDGNVWTRWLTVMVGKRGRKHELTDQWRLADTYLNGEYRMFVMVLSAGVTERTLVHRFVALAFFGPPPAGQIVLHGDGDPLNNRLTNLRYGTALDNSQDAILHGTQTRGESHLCSRLTEAAVAGIVNKLTHGESYARVAEMYGVGKSTVTRIATGRSWRHLKVVADFLARRTSETTAEFARATRVVSVPPAVSLTPRPTGTTTAAGG